MSVVKFIPMIALVALLATAVLLGQSGVALTPARTLHAHGMVSTFSNSAVLGAEVTFEGEKVSKTASTDKNGLYETDLPVGLYTMTVQPSETYLEKYQRPLFRVESPTSLTLNVTLEPVVSCDPGIGPSGHHPTAEDIKNTCGSSDLFPAPSEDNVPFQLCIRYGRRRLTERGYVYMSRKLPRGLKEPVFVTYNLFSLQADRVLYDVQGRALEATGNVLVESSDGTVQRGDSMVFKIENGEATQLP